MAHRRTSLQGEHALSILSGLLILASIAYLPLSRGSILTDLPEIAIPVGISLGIAAYSLRLLQGQYDVDDIERTALYGWVGAVSASFGVWWLLHQLRRGLGATVLLDEVLVAVSIGCGLGVVVGANSLRGSVSARHEYSCGPRPDREGLLAETVWTDERASNPIPSAIITQMAELEDVDPSELDPLYRHVNPDTFSDLRAQDDLQWQLLFYTGDYEIQVSSLGTVSIYDVDQSTDGRDAGVSSTGRS